MRVLKRNGNLEDVSFDKIQNRLNNLCNLYFLDKLTCDISIIAQKVCSEVYDKISTELLDTLSAEICMSLYSINLEYKYLASRISISNHHKKCTQSFIEIIKTLHNCKF